MILIVDGAVKSDAPNNRIDRPASGGSSVALCTFHALKLFHHFRCHSLYQS